MRLPEKRIIEMKKFIELEKMVSVEKLSEQFNISPITVRRDLTRLQKEGFLSKVHGGAIYKDSLAPEPVFSEQLKTRTKEKVRIAKEAAKRITDNDAIILESGTTCLAMVKFLSIYKNLKVSTAGIHIAVELWKSYSNRTDFVISICGGILKPGSDLYTGPHAVSFFNNINVNKAFISAVAVSVDKGISASTDYDSELTKAVISSANKVFLISDSSKFGRYSYINVSSLEKIDEIITDNDLPKEILKELKLKGKKVTLV